MTELEQLRADVDGLKAQLAAFRGQHFTPDGYLRYESIPQFVGGVTHLAGSEEILAGDRWEVQAPTHYTLLAVDAGNQSVEILNQTETGLLISIGVVTTLHTISAGSADVFLDITIDGGTTRRFQLCFADDKWGRVWDAHVTKRGTTGTGQSGDTQGDSLLIQFGVAYETSLLIEAVVENTSAFTGDWDLAFTVIRGVLT